MTTDQAAAGTRWKRIMGWVASVTAILGLIFGLQKLVGGISGSREQKRQVKEALTLAGMQQQKGQYQEAWTTLAGAEKLDAKNADVQRAEEDVAMKWLREAHLHGDQTFADFVKPLLPVVERGALHAEGQRKADLLAHAGWADFLKWRTDRQDRPIEDRYQEALQSDAKNPFAHAMWGHWILFSGGDVDSARAHFDAALSSGREREYVRGMQLAALMNTSPEKSGEELLRVANQMRLQNEKVGKADARNILWRTCYSDIAPDSWKPSATRLAPADEIATLQWLFAEEDQKDDRASVLHMCEARARTWAGDTARAVSMLRALERDAPGDATQWRAKQAADRLAAGRKTR